jgi:uncharacterized protein involved in exopolysaccharide biosynthesis
MRAEFAATPEIVSLPSVPGPQSGTHPAAGEVETALIGRILWRRRKPIAMAAGLAALAALGYGLLATPQYTATAQIFVDPRDKQVVRDDVNPSSIAADGGLTQVESQGSVLQSNGVLLRAIAATHLETDSEFNGEGLVSGLMRLPARLLFPASADAISARRMAETLQTLRKHVVVKRAEKVLVLDLSVRARTADRAASLANAIADAYLADQADARAAASRDASKELSGRLGDLQKNVHDAETAVADYRALHDLVVSSGQLVSDQEINQTTAQFTAAQSRAASLKAQLDQLRRSRNAESTPEAMVSGVMTRLRDRESAIVERLASASKKLGPLHPDIASLRQSLADVRALISRETQRLREAAEADYARALDDEKALSRKLDALKTKSLDDGKEDVRLRLLQQQADSARAIYQAFLTRARETLEAANVDTTNVRIITRALPPLQKSWPPTLLLVIGAAFAGLSLGAGGALAREYLRPTLLSPRQAAEIVGAPVLGVLGLRDLEPGAGGRRPGDALARLILRQIGGAEAANGPAVGLCLFVASPPGAAGARLRLVERLAALAAQEGRETLLIDGDIAHGGDRPGLVDFLKGETSLADLAYREPEAPFTRLASGAGDPYELPTRGGGDAFRLKRARRSYDLVALDVGPASDNPRTAALAGEADFALLVAEIGVAQADFAREAESLVAAGARFDAVALFDPGDA